MDFAINMKKIKTNNSIKFLLLRLFMLLICTQNMAQVRFTGVIKNTDSLNIENAYITINNSQKGTLTNAKGAFSLLLKKGEYQIVISHVAYKKTSFKLFLDKDLHQTFVLEPENASLQEILVKGKNQQSIRRLNDVENMAIYAGKKNEVIMLNAMNANLATNNARQIFAKVPGINIIENDAAGIQLSIATRGLNPNRTSEFNTRQNGYDISADPIGYPESYYSPNADALDRIEIVRGAASLQYGTQFGGVLNFQMKKGNPDKKIELDTKQTLGSYGLFNSYNAVSGKVGKLNYYTFFNYKKGDGWRQNSEFDTKSAFAGLKYTISEKISLNADLTYMYYLARQAGGLTDKMFAQNPQQSIRNRNWFQIKWLVPAISGDWQISTKSKINFRTYGLIAERGSIGNIVNLLKDRTDTTTRRQLSYDRFSNFGTEIRWLYTYSLFKQKSSLLVGTRWFQGNTQRQQGTGINGQSANFEFQNPTAINEIDTRFPSINRAVFVENIFWINPKWSITPGARFENIISKTSGISFDKSGLKLNNNFSKTRNFILLGLGTSYHLKPEIEVYANISENYSPINFSDIIVRSPNFSVDPNLKDVTGFNADFGFRGKNKFLSSFDISAYWMAYNNRIGFINKKSPDGLEVLMERTNIGKSQSIGAETFIETSISKIIKQNPKYGDFSIFNSLSYTFSQYLEAPLKYMIGNDVEYAPRFIQRTGITYKLKNLKTTVQYAYTDNQFSNADNTEKPTENGLLGLIPAYRVVDFTVNYSFKIMNVSFSANNITDTKYFTRRATGYPGPGIIPSDARSFFVSVGVKI